MNKLTRVLLVADNEARGEGLSQMLSGEEGIAVIGKTKSGEEARAEVRKSSPDVVIMLTEDMAPGENIIDITRAADETRLPARVIIITENLVRDLVPAIKAGVSSLLSQNVSRDELLSAIRKIHRWHPGSLSPG